MKYVNKFDTATQAIAATGLVAPQVVYVQDETTVLYSGNISDGNNVRVKRINGELIIKDSYKGLKFTSTGNSTISMEKYGSSAPTVDLKYSLDDGDTWVQWNFSAISLTDGQTICFKGSNNTFSTYSYFNYFVMTGSIAASGNIMSIIDDGACTTTTIPGDYCFMELFWNCTALTAAPELPATTLNNKCYSGMFQGCTALTAAPELPATTLAASCYNNMFRDCTSLNYIKCLATNISAQYCVVAWVLGVSATGTFVKAASMTGWTTGTSGIPSGWTVQDAA